MHDPVKYGSLRGVDMPTGSRFRFGDFMLELGTRELTERETVRHLSPKAFDLLSLLVESCPKVISKKTLIEYLWPDTFVAEVNLASLVAELRRQLRGPAHARKRPHHDAAPAQVRIDRQPQQLLTAGQVAHGEFVVSSRYGAVALETVDATLGGMALVVPHPASFRPDDGQRIPSNSTNRGVLSTCLRNNRPVPYHPRFRSSPPSRQQN